MSDLNAELEGLKLQAGSVDNSRGNSLFSEVSHLPTWMLKIRVTGLAYVEDLTLFRSYHSLEFVSRNEMFGTVRELIM